MNRRRKALLAALSAFAFLLMPMVQAQPAGKKASTLRGKVEAVNAGAKSLTVNHEAVAGWMDAMTMPYQVDKEDVLKRVKAGDQITAKVYEGDYTLYDVQVVPPKGGKASPKK